ncbi:alpha-fucosidase [Paenibacillus pectinilyticus]|uniref:alpha-L-fucosidase n=1 Tax=Paenibacillus pectinilyticus TaxID=512399 RepID=A0A1C0ZTH0_9BACL|nr:alpha-L-fucosidase [Paenibacillus pectinilyticus]OCT11361.1 alpha-fucosidase [Paenibacillus pectinilyticus]
MAVSIEEAVKVVPTPRQLAWQEMEFYAFIHFGINTFTGREWGDGNEDPKIFHPTDYHPAQWVETCRLAGMTGIILTCKHHDGFCLWPSAYTDHSVKSSTWQDGKGDVVRDLAEACRAQGLKFGVYLSPWDRHEPTYGDSPAYNAYFQNQLRELLTNYGEIFCVWFDGACGEGSNGKVQQYDWETAYRLIRELQPDAVINICGPDVRWCGNEAGHIRESEWSVVPERMRDTEKIQEDSQKVDDGTFSQQINAETEDLGSRSVLAEATSMIWYPAEVDVSIRPQWFYDPADNDKVKTVAELIALYESTVGGNSALLLNVPPDKRGLIHETDARNLRELGQWLRATYRHDLAKGASVWASHTRDASVDAGHLTDGRSDTHWCPDEGMEQAELVIDLGKETTFDRIVLKEYIQCGQRIERFQLAYQQDDVWIPLYEGTVVGYKKICSFNKKSARYIQLKVSESRINPTLSSFGVFCSK